MNIFVGKQNADGTCVDQGLDIVYSTGKKETWIALCSFNHRSKTSIIIITTTNADECNILSNLCDFLGNPKEACIIFVFGKRRHHNDRQRSVDGIAFLDGLNTV